MALVSESGKAAKRKAVASPSATAAPDDVKARDELKQRWRAEEEALKLEKEAIENEIKNSTGSIREQWKYRMAVLEEKMKSAKKEETAWVRRRNNLQQRGVREH